MGHFAALRSSALHLDDADKLLVVLIGVALVCALFAFLVLLLLAAMRASAQTQIASEESDGQNLRVATNPPTVESAYSRAYESFRDLKNDTSATDAGLLGILAAVAAVIVLAFANDAKIGAVATWLLYFSFLACAAGFGWGRWRTPDQEKPLEFVLDYFEDHEAAQADATQDLVLRLRPADALLKAKRRWALAAVAVLVVGMLWGGLHRMLQ